GFPDDRQDVRHEMPQVAALEVSYHRQGAVPLEVSGDRETPGMGAVEPVTDPGRSGRVEPARGSVSPEPRPPAQVRLLEVHEHRFVESAQLLEDAPSRDEGGPQDGEDLGDEGATLARTGLPAVPAEDCRMPAQGQEGPEA